MIWLLAPLLVGIILSEQHCRRLFRRLVVDRSQRLMPIPRLLPDLLALSGLALILLALTPFDTSVDRGEPGPAIALVVDTSLSMQVSDVPVNRLNQARQQMLGLIAELPEAQFALIPFAGEAVLQVPLTRDHNGLQFFIDNLHPGLIDSPGSAPEEAVLLAQKSLSSVKGERLIILISDGERTIAEAPPNLSPDIPVYTLLAGTAAGGTVDKITGAISEAVPKRLASIAEATGGRELPNHELTPLHLSLPIRQPEAENGDSTSILLICALLLLLLRTAAVTITPRHALGTAALLLLTIPGCEQVGGGAESGRVQFNRGLQAAQNGNEKAALAAFAKAAADLDGAERGLALYNQGTLLLRNGKAGAAVSRLEQAVILLPGDLSSRDNLLLALQQQSTLSGEAEKQSDPQEDAEGEQMSPQQALQLLESVQLDPAAPPDRTTATQPTVLKEW